MGAVRKLTSWFAGLPTPKKALTLALGLLMVASSAAVAATVMRPMVLPERTAVAPTPSSESVSAVTSPTAIATSTASAAASPTLGGPATSPGTKSNTTTKSNTSAKPGTKPGTAQKPETELTEATVGLTNAQRKAIALDIIAMEERATKEADERYPLDPKKGGSADNFDANQQYWAELDQQYKAEVMAKHGITFDQLLFVLVIDVPQYQ